MGTPGRNKAMAWGLAFTTAVLGTGCSSTAPSRLSPQQRAAIEGKVIALKPPAATRFSLISSSMVLAGALDPFMAGVNAAKAQQAGKTIVSEDHLIDPATVIAPALLAELESKYGMKAIQGEAPGGGSLGPAVARADFVLEVEVRGWGTMYFPTNFNRYGVMLMVTAKIVDTAPAVPAETATTALTGVTAAAEASAASLREANCIIKPRNQPNPPTFTELMENDGVRLRVEAEYATQACLKDLKHSLVGD